MRSSQRLHFESFRKYFKDSYCFYVNLGLFSFPYFLRKVEWDLIIYDWSFLGLRFERERFIKVVKEISFLKSSGHAKKIAFPQDEFTSMDLLCEFINEFQVNIVYSVAPRDQWSKVYKTVSFDKVVFHQVLTGYLDDELTKNSKEITEVGQVRDIDIGYRTVSSSVWGKFNLLKSDIAQLFLENCAHLKLDIKIGDEFFFQGEEWFEFLSRCRYTLGVEGGSTLLDWDGSHMNSVLNGEWKEGISINENDGEINVIAISPRHLEACMTRTVQILVEGEYSGILIPWRHYIPLKRNFSNLNEVILILEDETKRIEIAENAYNDIVRSRKYTYRRFIEFIEETFEINIECKISYGERSLYQARHVIFKSELVLLGVLNFFRRIRRFIQRNF